MQAVDDARVACRVLAASTLLWPAAATMLGRRRQPTTREAREKIHADRVAAVQQRRQRKEDDRTRRHASHAWASVGSTRRCGHCLLTEAHSVPACAGYPEQLRTWASEAEGLWGHTVLRGAIYDGNVQPLPLLVCRACGAWTSAAMQTASLLRKPCKEYASRAGETALRRISKGKHPGGRTPRYAEVFGRWDG